jgi:hypothetical protein
METYIKMRNPDATSPATQRLPLFLRFAKLLDLFVLAGAGDGDRTRDVQLGNMRKVLRLLSLQDLQMQRLCKIRQIMCKSATELQRSLLCQIADRPNRNHCFCINPEKQYLLVLRNSKKLYDLIKLSRNPRIDGVKFL